MTSRDSEAADGLLQDSEAGDAETMQPDAGPMDALVDGGDVADAGADAGQQEQIVDGDVMNPLSCAAVCAGRGLACNDSHEWVVGAGGSLLEYNDGACVVIGMCAENPETMLTNCGMPGDYQLTRQRCACR